MNLLMGITGSISVYKSVDILRTFQKNGHNVSVIMTENAQKLISPIVFETFFPGRVFTDMFDRKSDPLLHINLVRDHDILLVAPATANIIGKFSNGIGDDLLSTTFLAWNKKVIISPAMNTNMYNNNAVKENINKLTEYGILFIEPDEGSLACIEEGKGRLPSKEAIYKFCLEIINEE
ncbi:MAG: flavoprotein [Acidobacteriota bacterium]